MNAEKVRELFDYRPDGFLVWKVRGSCRSKPGTVVTCKNTAGYIVVRIDDKLHYVHRLVWLWHNGEIIDQIDHIDHDRSNNCIENLRCASSAQNARNRTVQNNKKYSSWHGVTWFLRDSVWKSQIRLNGKNKHLGYFKDEADAAQAYNFAAWQAAGEYANLNNANQTGLENVI